MGSAQKCTKICRREDKFELGSFSFCTTLIIIRVNCLQVNVVVGNNTKLGLLIRGGSEYGLGIFVAGIDEDSVADRSGIMVRAIIYLIFVEVCV